MTYLNCYSPTSNSETDRTTMPVLERILRFRALKGFPRSYSFEEARQNWDSDLHFTRAFPAPTTAPSQCDLCHSVIHSEVEQVVSHWDLVSKSLQSPISPADIQGPAFCLIPITLRLPPISILSNFLSDNAAISSPGPGHGTEMVTQGTNGSE